jgi:hypothetical protein
MAMLEDGNGGTPAVRERPFVERSSPLSAGPALRVPQPVSAKYATAHDVRGRA